jgi:hypothetical protein
MAFTRFNYDDCRTEKLLQESTGPGRYILNTPGWGDKPNFINDPQIRMQNWGANLRHVPNGSAIDIHSDLLGITRKLTKDCKSKKYPNKAIVHSQRVEYPIEKKCMVQESRVTHPAWMYKDLEQDHRYYLHVDPQENVFMGFQNNLNTTLLERDNHRPIIPDISNKSEKKKFVNNN